ncbi:MAG TPA: helix-turn-helix domain-containing protein [Patescibacteria group bacterium]|nr:helix-turn-helix domain-containing protein [Patescibacteria group bacterium]
MDIPVLLKNFGLNDKETAVYLALIELGSAPVRAVADRARVNRGTAYDILKALAGQGLVAFSEAKTRQYFTAEPPEKLLKALEEKQAALAAVAGQIRDGLPELKSLYAKQGGRPAFRFYEGVKGIKSILEDVLDSLQGAADRTYYVYSSASLRGDVYQAMPEFSKRRVQKKIKVKTIAFGEGGQLVGLDERKWLKLSGGSPEATYEILYAGKVAHISQGSTLSPIAVLIENEEIYRTQKMVFEFVWSKL